MEGSMMIPLYQISVEVAEYEGVPRVTFDLFRKGPPPFDTELAEKFDAVAGGADSLGDGLRPELLRVKRLDYLRKIRREAFTAAEVVAIRKRCANDEAKELTAKASKAMPDQPPIPMADRLLDAMAVGAGDWMTSSWSAMTVRSLSDAWCEEPISEHGVSAQATPLDQEGDRVLESGELWAVVWLDDARERFDREIDEALSVAYDALHDSEAHRRWLSDRAQDDGCVCIELSQLVGFIAYYTATHEDLIDTRLRTRFSNDSMAVPVHVANRVTHNLITMDDDTGEVIFRICCGSEHVWLPVRGGN
jgi:hypothetical protein